MLVMSVCTDLAYASPRAACARGMGITVESPPAHERIVQGTRTASQQRCLNSARQSKYKTMGHLRETPVCPGTHIPPAYLSFLKMTADQQRRSFIA